MRYVGRIISTGKVAGVPDLIEVTSDASSVVDNDTKIPTLIIGYKNAQDICGPLKTRERRIGRNLYWTFSKRERRVEYEPDLAAFMSRVSDFLLKYCDYEYVDLITCDDGRREELLGMVSDNRKKVVYDTGSMLYIYCPKANKVYGVSTEVLKFLGIEEGFVESFSSDRTEVMDGQTNVDTSICKSKFVQPVLHYLRSF